MPQNAKKAPISRKLPGERLCVNSDRLWLILWPFLMALAAFILGSSLSDCRLGYRGSYRSGSGSSSSGDLCLLFLSGSRRRSLILPDEGFDRRGEPLVKNLRKPQRSLAWLRR